MGTPAVRSVSFRKDDAGGIHGGIHGGINLIPVGIPPGIGQSRRDEIPAGLKVGPGGIPAGFVLNQLSLRQFLSFFQLPNN